MKYYTEHFGLQVTVINNYPLPTIKCICGCIFTPAYEEMLKTNNAPNCPKCNEWYDFQTKWKDDRYILIRPRTNAQIHWFK